MTQLPMPVCCNVCGRWFLDAGKAEKHSRVKCKPVKTFSVPTKNQILKKEK